MAKATKIKKKSPTNALTKAVIEYLNLTGNYVWRNNTIPVFDPIRKTMRANVTKNGIADIIGMNSVGTHVEIEIKSKYERLSKEQKSHGLEVLRHDGIYLVIRNLEELIETWELCKHESIQKIMFERLSNEKIKTEKVKE